MMETLSIAEREIGDPSLPVSSLHLLVPPLQLLSAAMWQVLQQQDVLHYGKLEEFVSLVMETFPELLSESQRTELTLGLQQFGTKTDPALEVLLWEFLSRLDQLLPVPDLTQTVSWLNAAPSVLEVCVQCVSYPDQLKTVLRHHRRLGQLDMNATLEEYKLSSMFRPPSQRAVDSSKLTNPNDQSESRTDCIICLSPTLTSSLNRCEDIEERRGRKTGYLMSGVQTDIQTNMKAEAEDWEDGVRDEEGQWKEEGKERDEQRKGCVTDQVKSEHGQQEGQALSTLTTSCLLKEPRVLIRRLEIANNSVPVSSPPRPVACESDEGERSPWRRHELSSLTENGSLIQNKGQVMTQKRNTIGQLERPLKLLPSSSENGIGAEASVTSPVISPTNQNTGQTVEVSSQVFACSQCPFLHTEEVNLHQHIEKVHPDVLSRTLGYHEPPGSTHQHPIPPKTLHSPTQSPTGTPGAHTCSECGKSFSHFCRLRVHQRIHTWECPYHCSQSGKNLGEVSTLMVNQQTHTGEHPYQCSQCGKSFKTSFSLRMHQRTHTGERPYLCSQCGKSFTRSEKLKIHQRTHTGERPYHCSQCGRSFTHMSTLTKHQRTHTGERPYHCSDCGRSFSQLTTLKKHQRTHTGERPYHCSQCGMSFAQSSTLKIHQRTHTGERPYHCSQCGKSFVRSDQLKQHQRTHTGEFPYHCSDCGKHFTQLCNLKLHRKTHTGERPFRCLKCGKGFCRADKLKRHQRTHTLNS